MTPTEQDSNCDGILKQRIYEEIAVIFAGKDLSHEQIAALMDDRKESVELIMRLIIADRKRVALGARIDTLQYAKISPKFRIEEKIEQLRKELKKYE